MTDMLEEQELYSAPAILPVYIAWGSVGWVNDPDTVSLGTGTDDGRTLVKVTLKNGAPQGRPHADDGAFNGYQILAQLGAPMWTVPARGTRVQVSFPDGDIETPGNGAITFVAQASPTRRFGRQKTVLDFTGKDVVIVGKSVTMIEETNSSFVNVGVNGAKVVSSGSGFFVRDADLAVKVLDADGNLRTYITAGKDDISIVRASEPANPVVVSLTTTGVGMTGAYITAEFTTAMKLGRNASPATPVLLGLSGPAGAPSTCIWGAPTP
jgi:hypothetical protein